MIRVKKIKRRGDKRKRKQKKRKGVKNGQIELKLVKLRSNLKILDPKLFEEC